MTQTVKTPNIINIWTKNMFHTPSVFMSEKENPFKISSEAEWSCSCRGGGQKDRTPLDGTKFRSAICHTGRSLHKPNKIMMMMLWRKRSLSDVGEENSDKSCSSEILFTKDTDNTDRKLVKLRCATLGWVKSTTGEWTSSVARRKLVRL